MKIKIISDGNPVNTKVVTGDGVKIDNVTSITWHCGVGGAATATIELVVTEAEVVGELLPGEYRTVDVTPVGEKYERNILVERNTA